MSKFSKKKKEMPGVNTASLPDIVFMLLFFFMVTTVMRNSDLKIKKPKLPQATEVKKLEQKSLVNYIYVGKMKGRKGDVVQLNDKIMNSIKEIQDFTLQKLAKLSEDEKKQMTTSIKADVGTQVGTIYDIKHELIEVNALKINYSTMKKGK
jgi:biopolymer transport protein ExbD